MRRLSVSPLPRWLFLAAMLVCPTALLGTAQADTLRVGYQRYGTLIILKERGLLEQTLKPLGWTVEWKLFPAGPQLLEAMNAGAIDFGIAGETPPVFAQAAGTPLVYVGCEPAAPTGEAILVPAASPITSVAGLKGRRVALNRGSNVHYLLVRALQQAGLSWSDITPVYLSPADAPAAFQAGAVDAWAIWDPYESTALTTLGARVLRDGSGLVPNHQFFLATRALATSSPQVLEATLAEVAATDAWSSTHKQEAATLLSRTSGLPLPVVQHAVDRLSFGVLPMTPEVVGQQQQVADTLAQIGLIPSPVQVRDAVLPASK